MKLKKVIAFICILTIAASSVMGCSKPNKKDPNGDGNSANSGKEPANMTAPGDSKISNEKITISAFASPFPEVKLLEYDYDKNHFTKWLEDTTNIHIKWVLAPSAAEISQKLSMLINSGDIPDIMFQNGFTPSVQEIYGNQGLILPLNEYIEKYGFWTKKMFEETPMIKEAVSLNEGKIYCMPSYAEDTHMKSFYKMWIYKPWLDKLKLPMPTTTEEFYQTLKAFKEKDPNGNNKQDEIPLLGCTAWVSWNPTTYLMNSFVYYDPSRKMTMENGKVAPVFTTQAFREGLQFLNRLSQEGLMSPETFTMDFNQFKQAVENPDVPLVGVIPSHAPFVVANTRYKDYVPMAPMTGPNGVSYAHYNYITNNMGTVISANCKYPVEAFRLLDFLYAPETGIRCRTGRQGYEWDVCKEGEGVGNTGQPAKYKTLKDSDNPYDQNEGEKNTSWYLVANTYNPASLSDLWLVDEKDKDNPHHVLTDSTLNLYIPHQPDSKSILPQTIVFTEEESAEVADIEISVNDYITETMSRFILGMGSIDKEWDTYVKELDKMGLARMMAIYQKAIERRAK